MTWRTHFVVGIASLWFLELLPLQIEQDDWAVATVGAMLGALLPDLDASESKIRHLGWKMGEARIQPFQPLSMILHKTWGHRGFLHSVGGWISVTLISWPLFSWISWSLWFGLVLGFGSHLTTDALTKTGIPFWQWRPKRRVEVRRVHLVPLWLRITTGSAEEEIYFAFFSAIAIALLLRQIFPPP